MLPGKVKTKSNDLLAKLLISSHTKKKKSMRSTHIWSLSEKKKNDSREQYYSMEPTLWKKIHRNKYQNWQPILGTTK